MIFGQQLQSITNLNCNQWHCEFSISQLLVVAVNNEIDCFKDACGDIEWLIGSCALSSPKEK